MTDPRDIDAATHALILRREAAAQRASGDEDGAEISDGAARVIETLIRWTERRTR